jgi:hypothetical protein
VYRGQFIDTLPIHGKSQVSICLIQVAALSGYSNRLLRSSHFERDIHHPGFVDLEYDFVFDIFLEPRNFNDHLVISR